MNQTNLKKLSIIVPTYKEAQNLPTLLNEVSKSVNPISKPWEILIVDDDSRDGTVEVCEKMARGGVPVKLITRKNNRGLATAVLEGFAHARGEIFVVMDADLSHSPKVIPELYECVQNGAEFVVGSRYLGAGSTDDKWTAYRFLNSKFATLLARPLTSISDPMSGFFALPRYVWEKGRDFSPLGYKIGLELIVKCHPNPIQEIPIDFQTRKLGQSKLSLAEQIAYLIHIYRLYKFRLSSVKNP